MSYHSILVAHKQALYHLQSSNKSKLRVANGMSPIGPKVMAAQFTSVSSLLATTTKKKKFLNSLDNALPNYSPSFSKEA